MILTEEEARSKWCPEVRHLGDGGGGGGTWNRTMAMMTRIFGWDGSNPYPDATCNCIASECMAWRWVKEFEPYVGDRPSTQGYCGKAGKP